MGSDTLVDVVNGIWSLGSTLIGKIKDVANQTLNAVKAGLEFIANAVLDFIISSIVSLINNAIRGLTITLNTLLGGSMSESNGLFCLNGFCFGIKYNNGILKIILGDLEINIDNLFVNNEIFTETLSPKTDAFGIGFALAHLGTTALVSYLGQTDQSKALLAILGSILLEGSMSALFLKFGNLNKDELSNMLQLYLFGMISSLAQFLSNLGSAPIRSGNPIISLTSTPIVYYISSAQTSGFQKFVGDVGMAITFTLLAYDILSPLITTILDLDWYNGIMAAISYGLLASGIIVDNRIDETAGSAKNKSTGKYDISKGGLSSDIHDAIYAILHVFLNYYMFTKVLDLYNGA